MSAPPTGANAGSSSHGRPGRSGLLPTPTVRDEKGPNQRGDRSCLHGALLPTPTVSDANGPGPHGTGAPDLRTAVSLLPTPTAADSERTSTAYIRGNPTLVGALLPTVTVHGNNNFKGASPTSQDGLMTALRKLPSGASTSPPSIDGSTS